MTKSTGRRERVANGVPDKIIDKAIAMDTEACIMWPLSVRPNGYGTYRQGPVHREVCRRVHGGPTEDQKHACHSCGNRLCINPKHLYWGTIGQNSLDKWRDGTMLRKIPRRDNSSGFTGISYDRVTGQWKSELMIHGIKVLNKRFGTMEEAISAREYARRAFFSGQKVVKEN